MRLKKLSSKYIKDFKEDVKNKTLSEITFEENIYNFVQKKYLKVLKKEYRDFIKEELDNGGDEDLPLAASVNNYKSSLSEETTALSGLPINVRKAFTELKKEIKVKANRAKSPIALERLKEFPEKEFKEIFENVVSDDYQLKRIRSSLVGYTNNVTGSKFESIVKEQILRRNKKPIKGLVEFLENNIDESNLKKMEVSITALKTNMFDIEVSIDNVEIFRIHCKLFTKQSKTIRIGINRDFELGKEDYVKKTLSRISGLGNIDDYYRKTDKLLYIKMREILNDLSEKQILSNLKPILSLLGVLEGKDLYVISNTLKGPINDIKKIEKEDKNIYFINDEDKVLFTISGHTLSFR